MFRPVRLLVGLALGASVAACSASGGDSPAEATMAATSLDPVPGAAQPPARKFSRTTFAHVGLGPSAMMLDLCRGPIAIDLGPHRPVLVAEHDYCGGSDWIPALRAGDAVGLNGDGVADGTYIVVEIETETRGEARVNDLPAADVVLQTCISPGEIVLVGMNQFQPSMAS